MKKIKLPTDINRMRIIAQGLIPSMQFQTFHDTVKHLLAAQAQSISAWTDAMNLRTKASPESPSLPLAFGNLYDKGLLRSRPMRGTLHVTTADDHHLMRLACNLISSYNRRNEAAMGIDDNLAMRAFSLAEDLILNQSEAGIDDLHERWLSEGIVVQAHSKRMTKTLLDKLDRDGLLAQAYVRKNQPYFIVVKSFPSPSGTLEEMRVQVTRRYIYSHGPIQADDLARWTGFSLQESRKLLHLAIEDSKGKLIAAKLIDGNFKFIADNKIGSPVFGFRADLFDLLEQYRAETKMRLLLPPFDELHNGYMNRTCLCDEEGERLICPAKNGTNRSILMEDGKMIGIYHKTERRYHYL